MNKLIDVTAAIIIKDNKVFAARRKEGLHLAGSWEFPGGKVEAGETRAECLQRELKEELGIETMVGSLIGQSTFDYGEKKIQLSGYEVEHLSGDFNLSDHDKITWLSKDDLFSVDWAPADIPLVEQYLTQSFYNVNAKDYSSETIDNNLSDLHEKFLKHIPSEGKILDLGCGSGRDSKVFIDAGFNVTAIDSSAKLVELASAYTGLTVLNKSYFEIDFNNEFDGVWACASLLHCHKSEIERVLSKIFHAIKSAGVFYGSFKEDTNQATAADERYFEYHSINGLREIFEKHSDMVSIDYWSSSNDKNVNWINVLLRKN